MSATLMLATLMLVPGCVRSSPEAVEAREEEAPGSRTAATVSPEPEVIPLWPGRAPGAVGDEPVDRPTLTIVRPDASAVGTAVVVCPGGGYRNLALDHEGRQVARLFASKGVTAFVLTYRLGPRYRHPAMLQDVLQAIRIVRRDASTYGIRADRIGVMGFSAGGHLASSAATLFDAPEGRVKGVSPDVSGRPDFAILAYPVIVMGEKVTHHGSQVHLLGANPPPELITRLSTDRQVTGRTPPAFLFHTTEDTGVPVQNSLRFYQALVRVGVPAELHAYEKGAHGVGLAPGDPVLRTWADRMFDWLRVRGVL